MVSVLLFPRQHLLACPCPSLSLSLSLIFSRCRQRCHCFLLQISARALQRAAVPGRVPVEAAVVVVVVSSVAFRDPATGISMTSPAHPTHTCLSGLGSGTWRCDLAGRMCSLSRRLLWLALGT